MTEMSAEEIKVRNAEVIHDMSMDKDDPIRAGIGRCLKYMNPTMEDWLASEHARHTTLSEIVLAMAETAGLMVGSLVSAATKKTTDSAEQYEARWKLGVEIAVMSFIMAVKANPHLEKKGTPTDERT